MKNSRDRWLAITYAAAIFVSAFLLFQIQPLVSKRILPWFGGTPAVWTTCLLFFQTVLFAGYAYAHWSASRLKPRSQALVHAALIVLALILMHAIPSESWEPTGDERPIPQILLILGMSIGLPYFVLSATGPLLQAWFSRVFPGQIPYRLYALSNIGSLLALISYPFFFEPIFNLASQALLWTIGFAIYATLAAYLAWRLFKHIPAVADVRRDQSRRRKSQPVEPQTEDAKPPRPALYLFWLILAAFASVVLIATTNHISTDIAVMPLLWVVPLALYLITFIIAFDRPTWYRRVPIALLAIVAIYATAVTHHFGMGKSLLYDMGTIGHIFKFFGDPNGFPPKVHISTGVFLISNFTSLFAICLLCHSEIVHTRPAPQYLTSFYLMISAGGAIGGIFATIVAPLLLSRYLEWDVAMFIACLASLAIVIPSTVSRLRSRWGERSNGGSPATRYTVLGISIVAMLLISTVVLYDCSQLLGSQLKNVRWNSRNFFGSLAIRESNPDEPHWRLYELFHGSTTHGAQYVEKERRREPTTYYGHNSGIGYTIDYFKKHLPPGQLRMGVLGLGAGTVAAYPDNGESITFYEINPAIIKLADGGEWFTYLSDCRARGAHCDIRIGDARLTLERELAVKKSPTRLGKGAGEGRPAESPSYHILALDAFSGDSVPVHLLTLEAFDLYLKAIAPATRADGKQTEGGALAVHISNRYLNLEPVIRAAVFHFKLYPLRFYTADDPAHFVYAADWIILTRNLALATELGKSASETNPSSPPVLWTDDRSSLYDVLR